MKRTLGVIIAVIVVVGLVWFLSGRQGGEKEATGKKKVVEIVTWEGELIGDAPDVKVARAIREEFDRTHPNIRVVRRARPSGEERKVFATAMAGGTGPDLAEIPGIDTRTYIEQGFAADITDFIKEWGESDKIYPI